MIGLGTDNTLLMTNGAAFRIVFSQPVSFCSVLARGACVIQFVPAGDAKLTTTLATVLAADPTPGAGLQADGWIDMVLNEVQKKGVEEPFGAGPNSPDQIGGILVWGLSAAKLVVNAH